MATNINVDRNLLFAVIALQDDLIDQTQFADVCAGWAMQLGRPLAELLIERRWITEEDRSEVERKLERKLKKHKGDARVTLGAVAEIEARDILQVIENDKIRQSLNGLRPARGHVLLETLVPPPNQRDTLRYTLTRVHAEGGLGKIWIAHDTDLNRDVALKEIKSAAFPNSESCHRFLKEAQITGQLEHPNIVPVYELARRKEDDQPFYTMRFLRGQTLRDAADEFHRCRAGKAPDRLELQRQLLEPFVKVCQAVAYAHSRGVIHRDLKPENVVLGAYGEVVVLDWGLAKVLGEPDSASQESVEPRISLSVDAKDTETHGAIGTPAYMPPEQAEGLGAVDTRTDVYGLGAILFHSLTGRPPVSGSSVHDVLRQVQAGNLRKAREIEPTVPPALEAICSRALEHDRRNRYRSAEDLAEDVRRWLLDEPVSVYRDSVAVRFMRWGRRHRTLASSLAALLVTAVIGLGVGVFFIDRERARTKQQKEIADEQRQAATANAAQALHNLRLAQNAADGLLTEVADVDLAEIPQMEPVRLRLLEKAKGGYSQFLVQKGDDPLVQWGAARSLVRLGDIQSLLGDVPAAEQSYRKAAAELEGLAKNDPSNIDFQRDLARANHGLGVLLKDANRFTEGEAMLRKAIRQRDAIAKKPEPTADDKQAPAESRYQLGALLARKGEARAEDLAAYQDAIDVQAQLVQQHRDRPEYRTQLARYRNNLGILQNASGHPQEAIDTFEGTLELLRPLTEGPDALPGARWQFARVANNLAGLFLRDRPAQADPMLNRGQSLLRKLSSEFPAVAPYAAERASVENTVGLLAMRKRQPQEAVAAFRESVRLFETLKRRFPRNPAYRLKLAISLVTLNEALASAAPAEAEAGLVAALDQLKALVAEYPTVPEYQRALGRGLYQLGRLMVARKKPRDAVVQAEAAKAIQQEVLKANPESDQDSSALAQDQALLTLALIGADRLSDAASAAEQVSAIRPVDPGASITAAVLLIHCAEKALHTADGLPFASDCLTRAVRILGDAVRAKVIRSRNWLEKDELRALRNREDFMKLRDSLGESARTG
jgi:serine/threonine protein kinase/tetratricopeptide (TPR) repeat protein